MIGYRILAVILGLICLLLPVSLFFQNTPVVVKVENIVLAEKPLADFLTSTDYEDKMVKNHLKYGICGAAVLALGMALMFFISAVNPLGMRSFIVVVIICSILLIPTAIWVGLQLNIAKFWWIGDSISSLVLALLLLVFFPRRQKARAVSARGEEEELTE